jgi:hypothetical protein
MPSITTAMWDPAGPCALTQDGRAVESSRGSSVSERPKTESGRGRGWVTSEAVGATIAESNASLWRPTGGVAAPLPPGVCRLANHPSFPFASRSRDAALIVPASPSHGQSSAIAPDWSAETLLSGDSDSRESRRNCACPFLLGPTPMAHGRRMASQETKHANRTAFILGGPTTDDAAAILGLARRIFLLAVFGLTPSPPLG